MHGNTNVQQCKHWAENTHGVYDPLQGLKAIIHWENVVLAVSNPGQLPQWGEEITQKCKE